MILKSLFILILIILSPVFSIGQKKTDLEIKHLNGHVKSVLEISYSAKTKGGEIAKGKRERKDHWDTDKLIVFNESGYTIQLQEYDAKGKETKLHTYNYDERNNLICKVTLFKNERTITYLDSNVYDNKGHLTFQFCCSSETTFLCSDFVLCRTYQYDESGNEIVANLNLSDSASFVRYTYSYDGNRNIIAMSRYRLGDTLESKITYKYSESNRLIEENHFNSTNDPLHNIIYTRNEQGDLIKMVITFFKTSPNSSLTFSYEYEYDAHNNWVKKIQYKEDVPSYVIERTIEYYQ